MEFVYNDGGKALAGFTGISGDCVVRSIAIATELPYKTVYDDINEYAKYERRGKRKRGKSSGRDGVYKRTTRKYLNDIGWKWIPTMFIGSGCKVHLVENELPSGRLIVALSKHMTCVINGVVHDIYNPQRSTIIVENGIQRIVRRCVYGYFRKNMEV